ncbi:MAG: response regulator transcription factor [Candidatus Metalachnospira sp.]|nr:response regulator transcription factor [Candidatus Metalachnospira sp.]
MKNILVVEDEADIQELLENFLNDAGYKTSLAADGVQALELFGSDSFDMVLLDIMIPKIDGYGVCEFIRSRSNVPIIMLTALDSEDNQVKGFDLKIDDYITKPFSMKVLIKKIAAVFRRCENRMENGLISYKSVTIDTDGHKVFVNGGLIEVTQKEFELLEELLRNQGRVLTRPQLLDKLWGYDFYGDERIVDSHIKNLRKKLGVNYIDTIRGVGYRIDKEN